MSDLENKLKDADKNYHCFVMSYLASELGEKCRKDKQKWESMPEYHPDKEQQRLQTTHCFYNVLFLWDKIETMCPSKDPKN